MPRFVVPHVAIMNGFAKRSILRSREARRRPDGASPTDKPTVLLVDDHPEMARSVCRLLTFDFQVVGLASDGDEAIDAAQRLDPDLIVMDVAMPGRDGFQTARELERIGSRAKIVFLSMHAASGVCGTGVSVGRTRLRPENTAPCRPRERSAAGAGRTVLRPLARVAFLHRRRTRRTRRRVPSRRTRLHR